MIGTRHVGARYLGLVVAGVVALSLYTPLSPASAKVTPHATCACSITLSVTSGPRGTVVTVTGSGFTPSSAVTLTFVDAAMVRTALPPGRTGVRGNFVSTITIPNTVALGHGSVVAKTGSLRARAGFLVTRSCSTTAAISLSPNAGKRGSSVDVSGTGFCPSTRVRIRFRDNKLNWTTLEIGVAVDGAGKFSATETIPSTAALGDGYIAVHDAASGQDAKKLFTVRP